MNATASTHMTFDEKRAAALALLATTGIWRSNYAPPLLRLLWKLGIDVPPPHFVGFTWNFIVSALFFGVAWGLVMWAVLWSRASMTLGTMVGTSALAGMLFGLCMASYYRFGARRHKIPLWKDFHPALDAHSRA